MDGTIFIGYVEPLYDVFELADISRPVKCL